ncbi:MAG: hypothetical protein FJX80_08140 [Bacteroidetes bacterium]|nr:hypothetical protein [Bacteroidota bacterium]
MKFSLVFLMLFISITGISQCLDFEVRDVSGNDVFNAQWNGIRICVDDKEISLGSETVYISRSSKNYYGDLIFNIQEERGYGWPEVGYVKVASTMDIVEVKFKNSIVGYGVVSPYQKAKEEKLAKDRIAKEREGQLENDRKLYANLDKLIKSNQLSLALKESAKLNFPEKYHNYNILLKEKERAATEKKNEEERRKSQELLILKEKSKNIEIQLSTLIEKKDFETAAKFYIENVNSFELNKYHSSILAGLTSQYIKDTVIQSKALTNEFIEMNKDLFISLTAGKHEFNFNNLGNTIINNKNVNNEKNIPYRVVGVKDFETLKVGDKYMGGIVIKINSEEVVICSLKPLGSGGFDYASKLCSEYKLGGLSCRLPSLEEFESIMNLTDKLDSYEKNWYWTSETKDNNAAHVGIVRGDVAFVPKEHGKWIFAVTSIKYFKIPMNAKMQVSIVENKDQTKKIEYVSSSKKPIYIQEQKDFYYKTNNTLPQCQFIYNTTIPKNTIREFRILETTRTANGIIVFKENKTVTTDFQINKKD